MDELNNIWSAASTEMYQNAGPTPGADAGAQAGAESQKNDTVEEAEYTVVDEDKK